MVNWSVPAQRYLRRIFSYIAADSRGYAQGVIGKIYDIAEGLDHFSKRGRILPELNVVNVREVFVYSYRLIYEITEGKVYILAVIHMSRDVGKLKIPRI